ncbi:MAG: chloride channel protein [Acidimicrobiia bacterium]
MSALRRWWQRGRAHAQQRFGVARPDLREVGLRLRVVLGLAALVGVSTGCIVAAFDKVVRDGMFAWVLRQPVALAAAIPALGLTVAVLVARAPGHGDTATTDAYVRTYHERGGTLRVQDLWAKLLECAATLGSGGALGYEGPALLSGATLGSWAESRFMQRFRQDDAKVLMVAGAAAGIAAVFRAPLTGIVFALEVPYTQDLARRALLPALVGASTSYLTFVALLGTGRIFEISGGAAFDLRDLLGGFAVGVLCGALARVGAWAIARAKHLAIPVAIRVAGAGLALFALALVSHQWFDAPLSLGSGYEAIAWAQRHETALGLLVALFLVRFAATWFTVAGGGVGGLFIPLVTQGAIAGHVVQAVVHAPNPGLFPTVGIAAFLGAGYRTPLAGVSFVAEATGQPGFVVPALLAAAASQLVMGRWSFSPHQRDERRPNLIPLDQIAVETLMSPNPDTVTADRPLDECLIEMSRENRRWVPVVDDGRYFGLLALTDIAKVPPAEWSHRTARDVARTDVPTASASDSVAHIAHMIREHGAGAVAISDDGRVTGVVTIRDIANIERLLDRLDAEADP